MTAPLGARKSGTLPTPRRCRIKTSSVPRRGQGRATTGLVPERAQAIDALVQAIQVLWSLVNLGQGRVIFRQLGVILPRGNGRIATYKTSVRGTLISRPIIFMEHICDDDFERYYLGMVTQEDEVAPFEEHLLWCRACVDRADEVQNYVDFVRREIIRGNYDLDLRC